MPLLGYFLGDPSEAACCREPLGEVSRASREGGDVCGGTRRSPTRGQVKSAIPYTLVCLYL